MSKVRLREPALLNGSLGSTEGSVRHDDPARSLCADATHAIVRFLGKRAESRGHSRPEVNPLPLGLVAAGGTELVASMRLAGRTWHLGRPAREAAAVRAVQAGALVASARRAGWRVPLVSLVIAIRLLGLIGELAPGPSSVGHKRRLQVSLVLRLLALCQLRREAVRAESWDTPLAHKP